MVAIERKLSPFPIFSLLNIFTLIFTQKYILHTSRMPCHTQCLRTHLLSFSWKFHCSFYRTGKLMPQGQPCVQLLVRLQRIPAVLKSQSRVKERSNRNRGWPWDWEACRERARNPTNKQAAQMSEVDEVHREDESPLSLGSVCGLILGPRHPENR